MQNTEVTGGENCFEFLRHLFAEVISLHNGNMKHVQAIDYMNLLATVYVIINILYE